MLMSLTGRKYQCAFSGLSSWLLRQSQMLPNVLIWAPVSCSGFWRPSIFIEHSFSFYHSIFMLILEYHIRKVWWKCKKTKKHTYIIYFLKMFSHSLEVRFDVDETELTCKLRDGMFAEQVIASRTLNSHDSCLLGRRLSSASMGKNIMSMYVATNLT